ncbi:MAG TPA: hypothetical protein VF615_20855 [Longimicrobiaceae bacterium]|jgi:hypothetical protein
MTRSTRALVRAAFGAAVVAVLGFGAAEAFAATAGPQDTARSCSSLVCRKSCTGGLCVDGVCMCPG